MSDASALPHVLGGGRPCRISPGGPPRKTVTADRARAPRRAGLKPRLPIFQCIPFRLRSWTCSNIPRFGCRYLVSVYTRGSVKNGPPSRGQVVSTGSRSRRTGCTAASRTAPDLRRRAPMRSSSRATSRAPHSFGRLGGTSVSASSATRRIRRSGRGPNAASARRGVPNERAIGNRSVQARRAGGAARDTRR